MILGDTYMGKRKKSDQTMLQKSLSLIDRLLMVLPVLLVMSYIYLGVASSQSRTKVSTHVVPQPAPKPVLVSSTHQAPTPTVLPTSTPIPTPTPSPTPLIPQIESGDWPGYLMGNSSYNADEVRITSTTVSALHLMWTKHAQGGVTSQPVVVNNVVYWGSWDGYEHATTVDGRPV